MLLSVCLLTIMMVGVTQAKSYLPIYMQPEQIHIAFGDDPTQMWIVWNTMNSTNSSVQYMAKGGKAMRQTEGVSRLFTDGGAEHRKQYIHRVKLTQLTPGGKYVYRCGSDEGWSEEFTFTAMQSGNKWSPRFAVYGDMGNENPQSLPRLQQEAEDGHFDAVLHVGDFAYDFFYDNGRVGDEFMRQIEPIAANVPYMTCPGNHEHEYNFSNYKHRFVMPGDELTDKMFYSFNIGPAHIISFSTEFYYYLQYGIIQPVEQFKWLEKDLKEANKPENRAQQPWIITMGHRPMYCSNSDGDDCTKKESRIRTGLPLTHDLALEPLFYKYGVDLEIWAHEHSYERLWPVYDRKVYNGSVEQPYTNPRAPVHIITGSAGCHDYLANFTKNVADWSALHIKDYGYSRMTIHNATHLYFEQVSTDKGGKVIDSVWIRASNHGSFGAVRDNTQTQWRAPDHDRFNPPQREDRGYHVFSHDRFNPPQRNNNGYLK